MAPGSAPARLPNAEQARVAPEKTFGYLLDMEHRRGRAKARFFLRYGFTREQWPVFADSLMAHAVANEVIDVEETIYGMKYVVDGLLETPDGRNPRVWTVWMLPEDSHAPRFVTAYPRER